MIPTPGYERRLASTMKWRPQHSLVSLQELDREDIELLMVQAAEMQSRPEKFRDTLDAKILATLFYEPSTRTRLSFESAMLRLGGHVISVADTSTSSVVKGETLKDTVRMVSGYADAIALRHPHAGAAAEAAHASPVPILNAGDGAGEHPTQALLDAFTMARHFGGLDGLSITLAGDLRYGRTVHSLGLLLGRFRVRSVQLVSAPGLGPPAEITAALAELAVTTHSSLASAAAVSDVLYLTRVQAERLPAGVAAPAPLALDGDTLSALPRHAIIMHPLPRRDELPTAVDADPRAVYFEQARNGVFMRMALLRHVLRPA
jgi:aspartate carbamoyltransferase catalytic subunit